MDKTAAILTLGCKVNQYDELIIAQSLVGAGFCIVSFDQVADLYVINSCTVTHRGDADSRKAARNASKRNPKAFIILAGCYSQWASDTLSKVDGVDLVLGNHEKLSVASYLPTPLKKLEKPAIHVSNPTFNDSFGREAFEPLSRTRALLKIQDGCDHYCSYCIVPYVRGNPRSLDRGNVINRIAELNASGYKEIVITGVHLGIWGREHNDNLAGLVHAINDLDGEFRIRLSSIEPMECTDELIETLMASDRICRHLHIPIQSGCDRTLEQMNRPYKVNQIIRLLDKIKSIDPGWNIGTDLMIGFPSETNSDFDDQIENLRKLQIDYFHLFTYSPRSGTKAAEIVPVPSPDEIRERLKILKKLDSESRKRFIESQVGRMLGFIVEKSSQINDDTNMGISDNYIRALLVGCDGKDALIFGRLGIDAKGIVKAVIA